MADLQSSIPSMVDGLTPRERKILFCAFKKPLSEGVGVPIFCRFVSEHSAYRDGEQSLVSAILNMAKGNNNINLLNLISHFGPYQMDDIKTRLSLITRHIFHEADEPLLNYVKDNEQSVEPTWFIPIIPMVLVNGYESIGTKCTSFVPRYNPRDIIANLKRKLNGEDMIPMKYWCRRSERKENERFIEEYNAIHQQLKKKMNLCTTYMHLVDSTGAIKKYDTPEQIIEEFFHLRLEYYEKRKPALLQEVGKALLQLENKVRFILEVLAGTIILKRMTKEELYAELKDKGYAPLPKEAVLEASTVSKTIPGTEYDYLRSITFIMLTDEEINKLCAERDAKKAMFDELPGTPSRALWLRDLDALENQLDEQDKRDAKDEAERRKQQKAISKRNAKDEADFFCFIPVFSGFWLI